MDVIHRHVAAYPSPSFLARAPEQPPPRGNAADMQTHTCGRASCSMVESAIVSAHTGYRRSPILSPLRRSCATAIACEELSCDAATHRNQGGGILHCPHQHAGIGQRRIRLADATHSLHRPTRPFRSAPAPSSRRSARRPGRHWPGIAAARCFSISTKPGSSSDGICIWRAGQRSDAARHRGVHLGLERALYS